MYTSVVVKELRGVTLEIFKHLIEIWKKIPLEIIEKAEMLHLSRNSQNRPVRSRESFKSAFEQVNRAILVLVGDRKQLDSDCIVVGQSAKKVGLISDCGFISGK